MRGWLNTRVLSKTDSFKLLTTTGFTREEEEEDQRQCNSLFIAGRGIYVIKSNRSDIEHIN